MSPISGDRIPLEQAITKTFSSSTASNPRSNFPSHRHTSLATCGRGEEDGPGGTESLYPLAGGQSEVEADDRGALGQEDCEFGVVGQEGLVNLSQAGRWLRPVPGELGSETG